MDPLSDVLRAVRLAGAVFFDVTAAEPWVVEAPPGASIVRSIFPGAGHLISYHVVTEGACWAGVVGASPTRLAAGDIVVFPHGHPHVMSSGPGMRGQPDLALYALRSGGRRPFAISLSAENPGSVHLVCGFLGCDARPFNPLLGALPPIIRVSERAGGVIGAFVQLAVAESRHPRIGSECVLGRLSELMFVDVVRRHLETLSAEQTGWLAGLREPFVGRALVALHGSPARDWALDALAREVGLSRSALAERFTQFVGQPPMQYLANWRMQLAANLLMSGTDSVAAIASQVGYESEAAFSRAFKKVAGAAPGQWRKERRQDCPKLPEPSSR